MEPTDILAITHVMNMKGAAYPMKTGDTILIDGVVYEVANAHVGLTCDDCALTAKCLIIRCFTSIGPNNIFKVKFYVSADDFTV